MRVRERRDNSERIGKRLKIVPQRFQALAGNRERCADAGAFLGGSVHSAMLRRGTARVLTYVNPGAREATRSG